MNSCYVFLYSVVRPMFIFNIRLFFFVSVGPTNEGVHNGPPKSSYATGWEISAGRNGDNGESLDTW